MKLSKSSAAAIFITAVVIMARDLFKTSKSIMDGIALSFIAVVSLYFVIASFIARRKEPEIYNAKYTFIAIICFAASAVLLIFFFKSQI